MLGLEIDDTWLWYEPSRSRSRSVSGSCSATVRSDAALPEGVASRGVSAEGELAEDGLTRGRTRPSGSPRRR